MNRRGPRKRVATPATIVAFSCLLVNCARGQVTESKPNPQEVVVHVSDKGSHTIPDTLFGSFLEPIGNSINNGVSAEILVNRSLEDGLWNHVNLENMFREQPELIESSNETGIPLPWQSLNTQAGNRFELHVGDAANSWQSLEIMGQPDQLTGIKQKVYLPVHRVLGYKVSLFARHLTGPELLHISFRDRSSGKVLAEAEIKAAAKDWTKYSAVLELKQGSVRRLEAVDFAVSVEGTERVDVDQISLMPTDAVGTLDPDEVAMLKAMHITELRFGGNFSSYYHWRDGVGPEDKRLTTKNIAWGIPEYNNFGTDEFLQLCDLVGAIPQFNINMGSGTPEEAADWVRYIHEHHKGRVIFEIGNELYGKWQVGYPTINEIAARTLAFSQAVRSVDPHAEIIATGLGPVSDGKWNAQQLSLPSGTFDYLSLHFIVGTNHPELKQTTPDFVAASAYSIPFAVGPHFDTAWQQVEADSKHGGKVHFAVTEWLFNSKGFGERNFTNESPSWMNEGGALMAAGFLNTLLRHSDQVQLADMTGSQEFAGIWKRREQVYAVPAYYAFQMYEPVKGDTLLSVSTDSGTYDIKGGVAPLSTVTQVPYVDVVATRSKDGKTISLLCVNRSLEQDLPVRFDLGTLRATGAAPLKQISSASRYERNDEIEPKHVLPLDGTAKISNGAVSVILPRESVTVIRVPVK